MRLKLLSTIVFALLINSVACLADNELLIIAPDEFIGELLQLAKFKNYTHRPTRLLGLNYVYSNFTGADEAEQVKRCIAAFQQSEGIDHVLLVGDVDKFPVRWRWWGKQGQEYWGVSDLYYADLYKDGTTTFDDWDNNNNGLYGEIEFQPDGFINNDDIDFLPDVSVGRIPASTKEELKAYISKIINYESKTYPWSGWFNNVGMYTGCWDFFNNVKKDEIGSALASAGYIVLPTSEDQRIRYGDWYDCPEPNDPNKVCCDVPLAMPDTILADMNNGMAFGNFLGHGNSSSWADLNLTMASLASLSNADRLPVLFAGSCDTAVFAPLARFDPYMDESGASHCGTVYGEVLNPGAYPHTNLPKPACIQDGNIVCNTITHEFDRNCIAETFVFGNPVGPTGAIAYLGERSGGQVYARMLDEYFFDAHTSGGFDVLGTMWKYMIEQYYSYYDLQDADTWSYPADEWKWGHIFDEPQKLLLFGDPSLVIGGAFQNSLCNDVYDGNRGPLQGNERYRISCDVTVPAGQKLTAYAGAAVFFEQQRKMTAVDSDPAKGFIATGTPANPVTLMATTSDPNAASVFHGVKVMAQMKLHNGGQIKLY